MRDHAYYNTHKFLFQAISCTHLASSAFATILTLQDLSLASQGLLVSGEVVVVVAEDLVPPSA